MWLDESRAYVVTDVIYTEVAIAYLLLKYLGTYLGTYCAQLAVLTDLNSSLVHHQCQEEAIARILPFVC